MANRSGRDAVFGQFSKAAVGHGRRHFSLHASSDQRYAFCLRCTRCSGIEHEVELALEDERRRAWRASLALFTRRT